MSTKFGLAGGIPERKVKPIWDAVDSRQFKQALKLSNTLLSKYPKSPYALALKALILERMAKPDEALTLCLNAKEQLLSSDSIYVDDLTLSTLQIVFQRLDQLNLATTCYELACEKDKLSNNLELLTGLFNCYVRENLYFKQQQTAMKMYKIMNEERFILWAVCSIQLQVLCGNGEGKLLHLAEALLERHISSHSLHEQEALMTYISILEQQHKYLAALKILAGELGSLIVIEVDKLRLQGRLLARAGDYAAAADIFGKFFYHGMQMIILGNFFVSYMIFDGHSSWDDNKMKNIKKHSPDDWESFLHYLDCILEVDIHWPNYNARDKVHQSEYFKSSNSSNVTTEMLDSRISGVSFFIQKLQLEANYDSFRCFHLASIEIEKRRHMYGISNSDKYIEAVYNYFCRFYHLGCFASDVEMFLYDLTSNEREDLLSRFVELPESSLISSSRRLAHSITLYKLQELLGLTFTQSAADLKGTAVRMVEIYLKNLFLSNYLDPKENIQGEELLAMSCNILVQLFWRTNNLGHLLEAIMVLEFGLTIRRFTWQYKILLVHLYSVLAAYPLAFDWYKTLEIKNILLETVSHHILPQTLNSPMWLDVSDLLKDYLKFMDDYMREAADHTCLACRHRNYSKVIETVQFKEQLQHSHQYLMFKVETSLLQLKQNANSFGQVKSILENLDHGKCLLQLTDVECECLTTNYDMQSRPWWSPAPDVNHLLEPFEANLVLPLESRDKHDMLNMKTIALRSIKKRSLIPRLICLSMEAASSSSKDTAVTSGSLNDANNGSEFKHLMDQYAINLGHSFDDAVKITIAISEGDGSFKDSGSDVVHWLNFAIFLNALSVHTKLLGVTHEGASRSWHIVDQLVKKCITEQLESAQPLLASPGRSFPLLTQLISESFSWHMLVLQSCLKSIMPSGKKKKKAGPTNQNLQLSEAVKSSISTLKGAMSDVKRWLQDQINQPVDQSLDFLLSHLHKEHDDDPGRIFQLLEQSSSTIDSEVDGVTRRALESWSSSDVARKLICEQKSALSELNNICELKMKLLDSMKAST